MTRKLWSTTWPEIPGGRTRFDSKALTYRTIRRMAVNWRAGGLRSPLMNVYVDERDGQGWQLYERIDLRELPDRE